MKTPEYYENDLLLFFDGKPAALALYQALYSRLDAAFPGASVKVQKTQISFYSQGLFAMVSLPKRKHAPGIVITFGLGRRETSPRVAMATEPYPGRWTHHVPVVRPEELDGALMGWIQEAWGFCQAKRRGGS